MRRAGSSPSRDRISLGSSHVVGDQRHGVGGHAPSGVQEAGALRQHPGLARTGRGDDPGPRPSLSDRGELVGRECHAARPGVTNGGQRSVFQSDAVQRGYPDPAGEGGVERSSVADCRLPIREQDIRLTRPINPRSQRHRLVRPVVPGRAIPAVDSVGPDRVVEPLPYQVEIEVPLPGLETRDRLGRWLTRLVEAKARHQFDDQRCPGSPRRADDICSSRVDLPDPKPFAAVPGRRRGLAGSHDDGSAQELGVRHRTIMVADGQAGGTVHRRRTGAGARAFPGGDDAGGWVARRR